MEDTPRASPWRSRSSPGACPWCPPTWPSHTRWSTSRSERKCIFFLLGFQVVIYKLSIYLQTLGKLFASSPNKGCLDFLFDQSRIEFIISIQFTVHSVRCTLRDSQANVITHGVALYLVNLFDTWSWVHDVLQDFRPLKNIDSKIIISRFSVTAPHLLKISKLLPI